MSPTPAASASCAFHSAISLHSRSAKAADACGIGLGAGARPGRQVAGQGVGDGADRQGQPPRLAQGTRLICRRERPPPGAQLTFTDLDGHRVQCFVTDHADQDIAALEATHRPHAQVEDRTKTLKATAASHLPSHAFEANAAWLELALAAHEITIWTGLLVLDGEHQLSEPKRLRYRIMHIAGQLTHHARRHTVDVPDWPWAAAILQAFKRLRAIPAAV
jgi:Transposase DDE domain group 1